MKNRFSPIHVLFVLLTLGALVLTACGSGGAGATEQPVTAPTDVAPATPAPAESGTAITKDLQLDPANATDPDSLMVVRAIYEGLFRVEGAKIVPVLGESFTASEDGLDYIIVLRPGVTFQDGSPLNADAVIANFTRWFDPQAAGHSGDFAAWASIFGGFKGETDANGAAKSELDGVEKVDEHTIIVHLTRADSNFIAKLNNPAFFIVSPAAFSAKDFGAQAGTASGSGPYKLASWTDSGPKLEPNTGYWGTVPASSLEYLFK